MVRWQAPAPWGREIVATVKVRPKKTGSLGHHNLPRFATSFIGRVRERGEVSRLASRAKLITLVGPGGAGKTRLVAEVARTAVDRFPDGLWWLDAAAIKEPQMVVPVLSGLLGVSSGPDVTPTEAIADFLVRRRALLVLDNCEHLLAACADLASTLLEVCRQLHMLVTSREPLAVAGEVVYPLPALENEEGVRLFIERARARLPGFEAVGRARDEIATLCLRLDGVPLAIELAAARVSVMTPSEMLTRLDRRFDLLASTVRDVPERQRTLRATIEWSYGLLEDADRRLLNRLSVFAGSFDLETAEQLEGKSALDGVSRLIEKSMVVTEPTARGTRYRLLESIRDYGRERLAEEGVLAEGRDRHLAHWLAAAEAEYDQHMVNGSERLLGMQMDELDNLRAALEYAQATDPARGLRLAATMRDLWARRHTTEGRVWLERLLPLYPYRDSYLGRALLAVGILAIVQASYDRALAALQESRDVCAEANDLDGQAWATHMLGLTEMYANNEPAAQRHLEEALELHSRVGSPYGLNEIRATMGHLLVVSGRRLEDGRRLLKAALKGAEALGNPLNVGYAHLFLGLLEIRLRNWPEAEKHCRIAVGEFAAVSAPVLLAMTLYCLARAKVRRDPGGAMALAAAATEMGERVGWRFQGHWLEQLEHTRTEAVSRISKPAAEEAWARGRELTLQETIELAQGATPARRPPGRLSRREVEVAELIAQGLSNRAAAERLHLSERTVEGHVLHILNKLGLSNRTQVATWLREKSSTRSSTA